MVAELDAVVGSLAIVLRAVAGSLLIQLKPRHEKGKWRFNLLLHDAGLLVLAVLAKLAVRRRAHEEDGL